MYSKEMDTADSRSPAFSGYRRYKEIADKGQLIISKCLVSGGI